ncbi:hypothetical protein [Streptomyces sp. NPDC018693]
MFTLSLPSTDHPPAFDALPASVDFVSGADIAVELSSLAWRSVG